MLQRRFPNSAAARARYTKLLLPYIESGVGPPHLVSEIETNDEGKLWSVLWEAMLFRQLTSQHYPLRSTSKRSGQIGPDFRTEYSDKPIWIEAIVPSPEGLPEDWLAPSQAGSVKVWSRPHEQMLLRCTSAIETKRKKIETYRSRNTIAPNDCVVVAINICRLSQWDIDGSGISQLPLMAEAVFPIGPLGVPISPEGKIDGPARHMPRFTIARKGASAIPTFAFLDERFAYISAVVQAHQRDPRDRLLLSTIHNPLAINPLPLGLFGRVREFVTMPFGDEYNLADVAASESC